MKRGFLLLILACLLPAGVSGETHNVADVNKFLDEYREKLATITDYQFRVSQWSLLKDKRDAKVLNYYWMPPNQIRIDVLEGDRGVGTTGILTSDGKVAARPPLGVLNLRFVFDIDHRLVTTNRGRTFVDASLTGIYETISEYAQSSKVRVDYSSKKITFQLSESVSATDVTQIVVFDSETYLPLESNTYENGMHVEHVAWSNFILNADLPERVFNISVNQRRLRRSGLAELAQLPVAEAERRAAGLTPR